MNKTLDTKIILEKILHNIDLFSVESGVISPDSGSLFDVSPFKSGRLRAKIANKVVKLPLKIANKSSSEFALQSEVNNIRSRQRIEGLLLEIESLRATNNPTKRS